MGQKLIKTVIKAFARQLPFAFTKNQHYDLLTKKIIKTRLPPASNCIDVGTHKGEIFDLFLKYFPGGTHFGFEPIPGLFNELRKKYANRNNCRIFQVALSDNKGISHFNYVVSNPSYSGLEKRRYDRAAEKDEQIEVKTDTLDNLVPEQLPVHFIKIDVEGGEMGVLNGGKKLLHRWHPLIVFECGLGGSDVYGTTPEKIFGFFLELNYQISLLDDFMNGQPALSLTDFSEQFNQNTNYYFIAHHKKH